MPKNFLYNASILKDSNKLISLSSDNWKNIKIGSYVKIGDDDEFYTVQKTNPIYYIKDFSVVNDFKIKLNVDSELNILESDTLIISYKEYELAMILEIMDGGKGYKIDDEIYLDGGDPAEDISNGLQLPTKLKINQVDENGAIKEIALIDAGKYINMPEKKCKINGGKGNGAVFEIEFKLIDDRKLLERNIIRVGKIEKNVTYVDLEYALPKGVVNGKLSVQKWEMILDKKYKENSKYNVSYSIISDFSPNYGFPKMLKNSFSYDAIYNQGLVMIDAKLKELENRISENKGKS